MSLWTPLCRSLSALLHSSLLCLLLLAVIVHVPTHTGNRVMPLHPYASNSLYRWPKHMKHFVLPTLCWPRQKVMSKPTGSDMNNLTSMLCQREQGLGPIRKSFCTLMHLDLICLGLCLCLSVSSPSQTVIFNQLAAEWGEWSSLQREVLGKTLLPGDNCPGSGHLHPLVRQQLLYSLCRNPSSFWTAV